MRKDFMPPHLADLIEEELKSRGWTEERAAARMRRGEYGHKLLALHLFLAVRDRSVVLNEQGDDFAEAFGVHRAFFDAIHEGWVTWAKANDEAYQEYRSTREAELRAKESSD